MLQAAENPCDPVQRIRTQIYSDDIQVSRAVASEIALLIRQRADEGRHCVLGLATGSTPMGVYNELIRLHREEGLSFRNVISFNLDEYYPMQPVELQSYMRYMKEMLFDHVDIEPGNIHVPDSTQGLDAVGEYCRRYEEAIRDVGGIDIQLLGIGRTGHIGFNEPGSPRTSRTRLIWLDEVTRRDAASDFFGIENVPHRAITMGVGTILDARRLILIAFGENKSAIIARAVEGPVSATVAASFLQEHPNAVCMLDQAAAAGLTQYRSPWLIGTVEWSPAMIRKAVIWLARVIDKPILKLTDEDYNAHGLQELIAQHGPAYNINIEVFRRMQTTITGWPGGKPTSRRRPEECLREHDAIFPKRVLIFSPHPDDDVISMGGTLLRLVEQGHEVHIAYQTSGNIAVFDADAIRFADFATDFNRMFEIDQSRSEELERHVETFLKNKKPGQVDSDQVMKIKTVIRQGEARAAARYCGVDLARVYFLNMPFYQTGQVRKKPLSDEDIRIVADLLERIQPNQVYAAGDLSDPHGTHRTSLDAIFKAVARVKGADWFRHCSIWLYRGAWQEWEPEQIDMAVPISPQELVRKRTAIFKHESQKDKALFPGYDEREFWQRAEDRNKATAILYDKLGLAEYEAIEGFIRWQCEIPPAKSFSGNQCDAKKIICMA